MDVKSSKNSVSTPLPMDVLLAEILVRLPAKTLLRFKCVCKFFKTAISSPEFIDLHLRRSLSSDTHSLVVPVRDLRCLSLNTYDLDTPNSSAIHVPSELGFINRNPELVGCCNGLFCIVQNLGSSFRCSLVNPCARAYKEFSFIDEVKAKCCPSLFGFGFDDTNKEYKLVRLVTNFGVHILSNEVDRVQIMVYCLKEEGFCIQPPVSAFEGYVKFSVNVTASLIDNHLMHWLVYSSSEPTFRIGCIDTRNDQWSDDIPFPIYKSDILIKGGESLGVMDDCLIFSCLNSSIVRGYDLHIWIMKEYKIKESWVKLMAVSEPVCLRPLAYSNGSRSVLLWSSSTHQFMRYNTRNMKFEDEIYGFPFIDCGDAFAYKESLITLPGSKQIPTSYISKDYDIRPRRIVSAGRFLGSPTSAFCG